MSCALPLQAREQRRGKAAPLRQNEVPAELWGLCCTEFGLAHQGWLADVALVETARLNTMRRGIESRWRVLRHDAPLRRVVVEPQAEGSMLLVLTGRGAALHLDRLLAVSRLFILEEDGAHRGMRIDGAGGDSMLIWFRVPAVPETLDGIVPAQL